MTDQAPTGVGAGTLVSVKTVTAMNIVAALGLESTEEKVKAVEQHIEDELTAIQQHFAMAVVDVQNSYKLAVAEITSLYSYVRQHYVQAGVALAVAFALGAVVGHVL